MHMKSSEAALLITVLQERNVEKARDQYMQEFGVATISDQSVYDLFEHHVFDAIMRGSPTIEIDTELAQTALLILKAGVRKKRGGQQSTREDRLRKRTWVKLAKSRKAELVGNGISATDAHLQAAEETAKEAASRGYRIAPGYLKREMEKPDV